MMNQSDFDTLVLTAYQSFASDKFAYFTIIFSVYLTSLLFNIFIIAVIFLESSLHRPMYIFLFNLTCIGLIGSTAVWPKVMKNLLSDTQTSSYEGCLCQVFIISVYATGTYSVLTVMAYDRYVSIINPLRYHTIMTPHKVKQLLAVSNLVPICSVSGQVCLTSRVPLCSNTIHKVYCENISVSRLSCVSSQLHYVSTLYGVCVFVLSVVFIAFFVLFSYIRIIAVSLKASHDSQRKAISTCAPHLIVFINFSMSSLFSIIYNQFSTYLSDRMHMFLAFQFILIPPLLHPIVYGMKTKEIRKGVMKHIKGLSKACLICPTKGLIS